MLDTRGKKLASTSFIHIARAVVYLIGGLPLVIHQTFGLILGFLQGSNSCRAVRILRTRIWETQLIFVQSLDAYSVWTWCGWSRSRCSAAIAYELWVTVVFNSYLPGVCNFTQKKPNTGSIVFSPAWMEKTCSFLSTNGFRSLHIVHAKQVLNTVWFHEKTTFKCAVRSGPETFEQETREGECFENVVSCLYYRSLAEEVW